MKSIRNFALSLLAILLANSCGFLNTFDRSPAETAEVAISFNFPEAPNAGPGAGRSIFSSAAGVGARILDPGTTLITVTVTGNFDTIVVNKNLTPPLSSTIVTIPGVPAGTGRNFEVKVFAAGETVTPYATGSILNRTIDPGSNILGLTLWPSTGFTVMTTWPRHQGLAGSLGKSSFLQFTSPGGMTTENYSMTVDWNLPPTGVYLWDVNGALVNGRWDNARRVIDFPGLAADTTYWVGVYDDTDPVGSYNFAMYRDLSMTADTNFGATGGKALDLVSPAPVANTILRDAAFYNNSASLDPGYQPHIGKIVYAGSIGVTDADFYVCRFNADGTADTGFGGGFGWVSLNTGSMIDEAWAVIIQSDGKIVAAGSNGNDFLVARFNADGSLDAGFGSGGMQTIDFEGGYDYAYAVAIDSAGRIVVAGQANTTDNLQTRGVLCRLTSTGSLDPAFVGSGKYILVSKYSTEPVKPTRFNAVALDASDRIWLAGQAYDGSATLNAYAAFVGNDGSGALASFGINGVWVGTPPNTTGAAGGLNSVTLTNGGVAPYRVLAAGSFLIDASSQEASVVKLHPGTLIDSGVSGPDTAFNTDGWASYKNGSLNTWGNDIFIVKDVGGGDTSHFAVFGETAVSMDHTPFVAMAMIAGGDPYVSFAGPAGYKDLSSFASASSIGHYLGLSGWVDPSDTTNFAIAGYSDYTVMTSSKPIAARLVLNGSLDINYSSDGWSLLDFPKQRQAQFLATAIDSGGGIIAGGYRRGDTDSSNEAYIVRFLPDGNLDSGFSSSDSTPGWIGFSLTGDADCGAIRLLPDGQFMAGGVLDTMSAQVWIDRYKANGSPDLTFGANGRLQLNLGYSGKPLSVTEIDVDASGNILASGWYTDLSDVRGPFLIRTDSTGNQAYTKTWQGSGVEYQNTVINGIRFIDAATAIAVGSFGMSGTIEGRVYKVAPGNDATPPSILGWLNDWDGTSVYQRYFSDVTVTRDGSIYASGYDVNKTVPTDAKGYVIKLEASGTNPTKVTSWAASAFLSLDQTGEYDKALSIEEHPDGTILVGGMSLPDNAQRGYIARIDPTTPAVLGYQTFTINAPGAAPAVQNISFADVAVGPKTAAAVGFLLSAVGVPKPLVFVIK